MPSAEKQNVEGGKPPHIGPANQRLDEGESSERYRKRWYQFWMPSSQPPPPPFSLNDATLTPLATASFISILTYSWLTPIMMLGYQRALQAPDLWRVRPEDEAAPLCKALDEAWSGRVEEARTRSKRKKHWRQISKPNKTEEEKPSLAWALNDALGKSFWLAGAYKVVGDATQLMAPLLVKAIIKFAQERSQGGPDTPHMGKGIGLAIGLPLLTIWGSICTHQFFWRSMMTGVAARTALTASLYSRGLRFRPGQDNQHLLNHISTDVSRIDSCAQWFHAIWTTPIQVTICLILLCLQARTRGLMSYQLNIRKRSTQYTDQRASLLRELLGNMRIVKMFVYEEHFQKRLGEIRKKELSGTRSVLFIKTVNQAAAFSIPVFAAVVSFVTYAATHNHSLDAAIVFPSLALFSMLRQPLLMLPRALSSTVDAKNAIRRLEAVFLTETIEQRIVIESNQSEAVVVKCAEFVWYHTQDPQNKEATSKQGNGNDSPTDPIARLQQKKIAFRLADVSFSVPRGSLTAIVGPVASGKSSLLLGILGEMPRTKGSVVFGGRIVYCAQTAWIQNATLRDNIVFGRPWDEERYRTSVRDASLDVDLEQLPDGDLTEVSQSELYLSGGQKQRVNIARALYDDSAEVFLLDDPLSAVDAQVGQAVFQNAILNNLKARGKTVLLTTHALHLLPSVDYIYTVARANTLLYDDEKSEKYQGSLEKTEDGSSSLSSKALPVEVVGRIQEHGTYQDLLSAAQEFARLVHHFGRENERIVNREQLALDKRVKPEGLKVNGKKTPAGKNTTTGRLENKLIQPEKRTTGTVKWGVYGRYFSSGGSLLLLPVVIASTLLAQGCYGLGYFWLVWWQNDSFKQSSTIYMIGYAALGIGSVLFSLIRGVALCCLTYESSKTLHREVLSQVFHAPILFFDTTPLGRILSVLGKDIDTMDNSLSDSIRIYISTMSTLVASVIVITILEHYFIVVAVVILALYQYFAAFYRASAREVKRLDASLRSLLYSQFSESLAGVSTIRGYGMANQFLAENKYHIDLENRALYLTTANQRWLAIRLNLLGSLLVFAVAIMSVVGVNGVSAAEIGLVLSTLTGMVQVMGLMTRQSAEVENNMNAVERVLQYTSSGTVPQEQSNFTSPQVPPDTWPSNGAIEIRDLVMSHRAGLPPTLREVSLDIRPGERIGIVGRTSAGKSSLISSLFRFTELTSGSIRIDGLDIAGLGLDALRSKIAIIPQEAGVLSGTVRSNIDPFNEHEEATLHDALKRSHLIGDISERESSPLGLDTVITAGGENLSLGQRSLLSLARALVKRTKILVLDEATASVDIETDSKIQKTVEAESRGRTILCIAHRIRTIINYDRVVVMDEGRVVQLGIPSELYAQPGGIFRDMCEQNGVGADEFDRVKA
ncbi:ABC transporter transmembrane region [Ceratobasidium sp. AG-Ba]|nr:ABC transporter transmembrane region [Ceratobasidium sp. AG-Ba]